MIYSKNEINQKHQRWIFSDNTLLELLEMIEIWPALFSLLNLLNPRSWPPRLHQNIARWLAWWRCSANLLLLLRTVTTMANLIKTDPPSLTIRLLMQGKVNRPLLASTLHPDTTSSTRTSSRDYFTTGSPLSPSVLTVLISYYFPSWLHLTNQIDCLFCSESGMEETTEVFSTPDRCIFFISLSPDKEGSNTNYFSF